MKSIQIFQRIDIQELDRLNELMSKFFEDIEVSENSKQTYKKSIRNFFRWTFNNKYDLTTMTPQDITAYRNDLLNSGLSPYSVSLYISSVKRLYRWLDEKGIYKDIAKGKGKVKLSKKFAKTPLSVERINILLESCKNSVRDYALINLLLRTGIRSIEAVRLDISDIQYMDGKRVLKVHRKGQLSKNSFVILTDKAYKPIKDYLDNRVGVTSDSPLFASESKRNKGKRITTRTVRRIVDNYLTSADIKDKGVSTHSLRHTTGTQIVLNGGNLIDVKQTLGHAKIETSMLYTEMATDLKRLKHSGESLLDNVF